MTIYVILTIILLPVIIAVWTILNSTTWLTTDGIIKEIEIIEKYNRPDLIMSTNKKSFEYILNLKYIYTVNNNTYTGNTVFSGLPNIFDNKKDAEYIVKKYSKNSKTEIYYDPANPYKSSLLTSKSVSTKGIITLVILVLFISLFVISGIIFFPKL